MSEIKSFNAGDSISWVREVADSDHTYQYIFLGASGKFTIEPALDGTTITATMTSAQTAVISSGEYHWFLFSTHNLERYKVAEGYTTVVFNPNKLVSTDTSTFASRMLSAIEKRLEGRILSDHENYSIEGRSLSRIPFTQLEDLRKKYSWMVRDEKVKRGQLKKHKRIKFRG